MLVLKKFEKQLNANRNFQKKFFEKLGELGVNVETWEEDEPTFRSTRKLKPALLSELLGTDQKTDEDQEGTDVEAADDTPAHFSPGRPFETSAAEKWPTQYAFTPEEGFTDLETGKKVSILEEFLKLEKVLGTQVVKKTACKVLDINVYGFPNRDLKKALPVKNGVAWVWDFTKFVDVFTANFIFRTKITPNPVGPPDRQLYLYTPEKGYTAFGPNEADTMLQTIGVPIDKLDKWHRQLPERIMNAPETQVPKFEEWNTSLIACRNGVLNPWTLELRPHSPDDYVKHRLVCDWNPDAVHPMADKIFNDIPDPDDQEMHKMMFAATLVGNLRRKFFVQKGLTGSGKSISTELWRDCVLGEDLSLMFCAEQVFGEGESTRFGFYKFDTAFMACCDDLTNQRFRDTGKLKTMTAGGTLPIETKGKNPYNAKVRAVVIFNANDVPNFEDRSGAILDRAVFINRDCERPEDKRINFTQYVNDENFRSRLLTIVMEALQRNKVQEENGTWSYKLPAESIGAREMRDVAESKAMAMKKVLASLLSKQPVIGVKREDLEADFKTEYQALYTVSYNPMGTDALSHSIYSIPFENGLRLQLYSNVNGITLIKGAQVRVGCTIFAFASTDPAEKARLGKECAIYSAIREGRAVSQCMGLVKTKGEDFARVVWARYMRAYDVVLKKAAEYGEEFAKLYELQDSLLEFNVPSRAQLEP